MSFSVAARIRSNIELRESPPFDKPFDIAQDIAARNTLAGATPLSPTLQLHVIYVGQWKLCVSEKQFVRVLTEEFEISVEQTDACDRSKNCPTKVDRGLAVRPCDVKSASRDEERESHVTRKAILISEIIQSSLAPLVAAHDGVGVEKQSFAFGRAVASQCLYFDALLCDLWQWPMVVWENPTKQHPVRLGSEEQ